MLQDIFGGILLGTGGLVKAYSDASIKAIENNNIVEKEEGYIIEIITSYENMNEFEKMCKQLNIRIINIEYVEKVKIIAEISKNNYKKIIENNFQKMEIKILKDEYVNKS